MKRLVEYDDDEDEAIRIPTSTSFFIPQPPPTSLPVLATSAPSGPVQTRRQNAKEIFIEPQAFDAAYLKGEKTKRNLNNGETANIRSAPVKEAGVGDAELNGPWAPVEERIQQPVQPYKILDVIQGSPLQSVDDARLANITTDTIANTKDILNAYDDPKMERHGEQIADYQGRRVTDARRWPQPLNFFHEDDEEEIEEEQINPSAAEMISRQARKKSRGIKECRIPSLSNVCKREYIGHSKGITRVRAFGCLALTSGLDGTIKLWDTSRPDDLAGATKVGLADEHSAIATYWGHGGQAVRDCCFPNQSASTFVSCGYDGFGLLWDAEKGVVINKYRSDADRVSVNAARFKTDDDNQLVFAFGDRKLKHWDIREPSDRPSQIYDFHQSSVSSVLFCENGNKFVSTGEDRKLLVWDWGVPTPVKIISELWIPGMPTTAAHPSTMSFVAVGLDNRLFQFRVQKQTGIVKKTGECSPDGFGVAGFACEPSYSPDGKYVACGDGDGNVHFLRTKAAFPSRSNGSSSPSTERISGAHMKHMPVSCVVFHPCFEGVLLTTSWDGRMKWWN